MFIKMRTSFELVVRHILASAKKLQTCFLLWFSIALCLQIIFGN